MYLWSLYLARQSKGRVGPPTSRRHFRFGVKGVGACKSCKGMITSGFREIRMQGLFIDGIRLPRY